MSNGPSMPTSGIASKVRLNLLRERSDYQGVRVEFEAKTCVGVSAYPRQSGQRTGARAAQDSDASPAARIGNAHRPSVGGESKAPRQMAIVHGVVDQDAPRDVRLIGPEAIECIGRPWSSVEAGPTSMKTATSAINWQPGTLRAHFECALG
jgi:hypothetical protein